MNGPQTSRSPPPPRHHPAWSWPAILAALRERIIAWTAERRARGDEWCELSRELGVAAATLQRRAAARPERALSLRPVDVIDMSDDEPSARTVTVVSPSGLRVEGVTVADAITIVRGDQPRRARVRVPGAGDLVIADLVGIHGRHRRAAGLLRVARSRARAPALGVRPQGAQSHAAGGCHVDATVKTKRILAAIYRAPRPQRPTR
jgi:hypothetical protein